MCEKVIIMEVPLREFCFKVAAFLDEEAMKLYREIREFRNSPEVMDYNAFKNAAAAINALGHALNKRDSPHHDIKIHLGNMFGFKVKEK